MSHAKVKSQMTPYMFEFNKKLVLKCMISRISTGLKSYMNCQYLRWLHIVLRSQTHSTRKTSVLFDNLQDVLHVISQSYAFPEENCDKRPMWNELSNIPNTECPAVVQGQDEQYFWSCLLSVALTNVSCDKEWWYTLPLASNGLSFGQLVGRGGEDIWKWESIVCCIFIIWF